MIDISWHQLKNNSNSTEISFELFCYQIANKKYGKYGNFEDYYNTAGSEFYLELKQDCKELDLKVGDIIGWQAKFWLNAKSLDNSPLNTKNREELVEGFNKSKKDKPKLKYWIICTPGKFSNNKPHYPYDKLKNAITKIDPEIQIGHWQRDAFETFFHSSPEYYRSIFNHYFNIQFIGIGLINEFSGVNLRYLENKFDVDLYVPDEKEVTILSSINIEESGARIEETIEYLIRLSQENKAKECLNRGAFESLPQDYTNSAKSFLKRHIELPQNISKNNEGIKDPIKKAQLTYELLQNFYAEQKGDIDKLNKRSTQIFKNGNKVSFQDRKWHDTLTKFIRELREGLFDKEKEASLIIQCEKLITKEYHVFGGAANGKTNFISSIVYKQIQKELPVLLFLGSSFKNNIPPKDRILQQLGLSNTYSFKDLMGAVNNLGLLKNTRIPIIIDGLNESSPTSGSVWKLEIHTLINDLKEFTNLILITTCRDKSEYVQQIFEKDQYTQIENYIYLNGFSEKNVDAAIKKYFLKKNISVKSEDYDKSLFHNPLRLKIFSEVNKGTKDIEINIHTIVNSIDRYLEEISANISKKNNFRDRIIENKLKKGLEKVGVELWNQNRRELKTFEEFLPLFDKEDVDWCESLTFKIIDEGLCFQRNIEDQDEIVQFSIDLIGGYQIAKSNFFSNLTTKVTLQRLEEQNTKTKLFGQNDLLRHPMFEDILTGISYLLPRKTGKQLFDIFPISSTILDSIDNLELIAYNKKEKLKLSQLITKNKLSIETKSRIIKKLYDNAFYKTNFSVFDLIEHVIITLNQWEIDVLWSELIRSDSYKLRDLIKTLNQKPSKPDNNNNNRYNKLMFCTLLTATNDKMLRSEATKSMVHIGMESPEFLLSIARRFKSIADGFILESIICSLTGVVLRLRNKNLTESVIKFYKEEFLNTNPTNHIAILDNIHTIFHFGSSQYKIPSNDSVIYRNKEEEWEVDETTLKELEKKDFLWSYEMMDYDFIKFQITSLSKSAYNSISKYSKAEIIAMIAKRIEVDGYIIEKYSELEKKNAEENKYKREEASEQVIKYSEKYLNITHLELAGYLMLNDQIKPEFRNTLRYSDIFFEPTFPEIKQKTQIINECFLPAYNEIIQEWVTKDSSELLKNIYITTPVFEKSEMILLYASITQKNEDNNTYMNMYVGTYIFENKHKGNVYNTFSEKYITGSNEINQMFAGEIPWREHVSTEYNEEELEEYGSAEYHPLVTRYSWSSWTQDRYKNPNFVFLNSDIAKQLELDFKIDGIAHINKEGKEITKYYKTDDSEFLFIERKTFEKFLKENNRDMLWNKFGSKYGDFGINEKKLDPTYKDFKTVDLYSEKAKS